MNHTAAERAWLVSAGRTRKPTFDELRAQQDERAAATLDALQKLGVNLILVPYCDPDPSADAPDERIIARQTIARCHERGLRAGVWLPIGKLDIDNATPTESALATVCRGANGRPVAANFPGRVCLSFGFQPVRSAAIELARGAVRDGADAIFLPDWQQVLARETPAVSMLREHVGRLFTAQDALQKELYDSIEHAGVPSGGESLLMECWLDCRVTALTTALADVARAARQIRPDVIVGVATGVIGRQIGLPDGPAIDPAGLAEFADVLVTPGLPRTLPRGEITQQIADLKLVRARRARTAPQLLTAESLAQQLAFGGDAAGFVTYFRAGLPTRDAEARRPVDPRVARGVSAYRQRPRLFRGMQPVADVWVWQPKRARVMPGPALSALAAQSVSALIAHRVPFDFLLDEIPQSAPRDAVILAAGLPAVSEEQAGALRRHVVDGGAVLIIGAIRVESADRRTVASDLATYLAAQSGAAASAPAERADPDATIVRTVGAGRVVALSRPGSPLNWWLTTPRNSKLRAAPPVESDAFARAVRAALGHDLRVEGALPRGLALELTAGDHRMAVQFVRFDEGPMAAGADMLVRTKNINIVRAVTWYDWDGPGRPLEFRRAADGVHLHVPSVSLYGAALIEW
ncbi:MAG: hypothetical protein U1A27_04480 [Phycisphaerae bacterium]